MINLSYENECSSPDGRENPFVPFFGTKDLEGQQEIASEKTTYFADYISILYKTMIALN